MTRTEPLPGPGLPGSGSGTQPPAGHGPGTKRFLLMVAGGGLVDCSVGIIGVGGGELHPLRLVMWAILFGWYQVPTLAVALAPSLAAQRRYGSGLRQATTQRLYWSGAVMMGLTTAIFFRGPFSHGWDSRGALGILDHSATWLFGLATSALLILLMVNGSRLAAGREGLFLRSG